MPIQYRNTTADINLEALRHNVKQALSLLPDHSSLVAVIKANAYGHGATMVSRTLRTCGVRSLAVATVEEAITLREQGIRDDIMVLGGLFNGSYSVFKEYSLKPVLHSMSDFERLYSEIKDKDGRLSVHLKFDTGMGRLGFLAQDVPAIIKKIRYFSGMPIESILTHLALADGSDLSQTLKQKEAIQSVSQAFKDLGLPVVTHFANSAALCDKLVDEKQWARPGIMLYGAYPALRFKETVNLKPVMTFKSTLIDVKHVPKGQGISYGHTFVTERDSLIGVVAVGYADGYSRALSNKGVVSIKDQLVPVVGRICMDLTLVDLTLASNIQIGDDVELWGNTISVDDVAEKAGTIAYEMLCGVSARVPRVYQNV